MNVSGYQNANINLRTYKNSRNWGQQSLGSFQEKISENLNAKQVAVGHIKLGYLHSSGNGVNGQELHINYDESSTKEEPIMLAEGIDMQGNPFKRKIYLNKIDVSNASIVEMTALNVHLREQGDKKVCSRINAPLDTLSSRLDLNQKIDFTNYYDTEIKKFEGAGFRDDADFYRSILERYLFFQEHHAIVQAIGR